MVWGAVMNINLQETQTIIEATKEQIFLQGKTHTGKHAKPRRGQVFNCLLGVGVGSEFQKKRPCVVLSNTVSNINTSVIVVAPITHTHKTYPVFVPISEKRDSNGTVILSGYADLSGLRSVSSYRLAGLVCELDGADLKQIDAAMARHLDLMQYYNTLVKAAEDREKHVVALSGILEKLRVLTETDNNDKLMEAVEKLIAENANLQKK